MDKRDFEIVTLLNPKDTDDFPFFLSFKLTDELCDTIHKDEQLVMLVYYFHLK